MSEVTLEIVESKTEVIVEVSGDPRIDITETSTTLILGESGPQGIQGVQGIQGIPGPSGVTNSKGIATLDFGAGSLSAQTVVTGYPEIVSDSVVMVAMRVEATPEHTVDELLADPIRVAVKELEVGEGFTIQGRMDNAQANGTYKINWTIR